MNDLDKIQKVKDIIKLINNAQEVDHWKNILKELQEFRKNAKKYPPISFSFTEEEIRRFPDSIDPVNMQTATEKLLCAVIWKNGDLLKIDHVIKGLKGDKEDRVQSSETEETAITFHHFGKYLAEPRKNPIIDQHVIRAYRAIEIEDGFDEKALLTIRNSGLLNGKKDKGICKKYIEWVTQHSISQNDKDNIPLFQAIDDVMFAFGRFLKSGKPTST